MKIFFGELGEQNGVPDITAAERGEEAALGERVDSKRSGLEHFVGEDEIGVEIVVEIEGGGRLTVGGDRKGIGLHRAQGAEKGDDNDDG